MKCPLNAATCPLKEGKHMIKIAVVDDSHEFVELASGMVKNYFMKKKVRILVQCYTKAELLNYDIAERKIYDIFFLDIEMPDINGIKLAERIREYDKNSYIILVTSHLKYSLVGYELNVFRYIPKNMIKEKLIEALDSLLHRVYELEDKIYVISNNSRYEKILYHDIDYIYKDRKNAVLVCNNNEFKVRKSLKQVYEELDSDQFIFIERGYIVNITQIIKVINHEVFLENGERLHIGRAHSKYVKEYIARFWGDMT